LAGHYELKVTVWVIVMASVDSMWSSGEICELVGKYRSRCCGTVFEHQFVPGDIFPRCTQCQRKLQWRRSFTDSLHIDTIETGRRRRKR